VYKALIAGSERGLSLEDNLRAFGELGFAPHVAGGSAKREQGVRVLGQDLSMPVLISPTGVQAVHPEGEVAVARAAAARGIAMGLSSFASQPIEAVTATGVPTFFQVYWSGSREVLQGRLARAKAAGAQGIILTLDWSFSHSRDWGSPSIPQSIDLKTALKFAPEVAIKPAWLLAFAKTGKLPDLGVPNVRPLSEPSPGFFEAYGEWMTTPPPSWDDVAWMASTWRELSGTPFVLKGVCRVDDARRAVDAGVDAISVSNHGGNNLDGTPAAIRMLKPIADAVGADLEVVMDGGIRRGSDVVKALALGARAVMIGRAYLWGLAANGQAGVENVLDLLRMGIDSTMLATGKSDVSEFGPSDILVPDGFARALGVE
jgi:heme/flavin dehydrogenase (mycofactocin system)